MGFILQKTRTLERGLCKTKDRQTVRRFPLVIRCVNELCFELPVWVELSEQAFGHFSFFFLSTALQDLIYASNAIMKKGSDPFLLVSRLSVNVTPMSHKSPTPMPGMNVDQAHTSFNLLYRDSRPHLLPQDRPRKPRKISIQMPPFHRPHRPFISPKISAIGLFICLCLCEQPDLVHAILHRTFQRMSGSTESPRKGYYPYVRRGVERMKKVCTLWTYLFAASRLRKGF